MPTKHDAAPKYNNMQIYKTKIQQRLLIFTQCIYLSKDVENKVRKFQSKAITNILGYGALNENIKVDVSAGRILLGCMDLVNHLNMIKTSYLAQN